MKIYELFKPPEMKDLHRKKYNFSGSFFSIMHKYGLRKFGEGGFSDVFGSDELPYIIKIFAVEDHCYMSYVNAVMNNDNPHFPKFRGKPMRVNEFLYAIRIEKLTKGGAGKQNHLSACKLLREYLTDEIASSEIEQTFGEKMVEALDFIRRSQGGCSLDMNQGNIMYRGDVPVIIDPYHPEMEELSDFIERQR